MFKRIVGSRQEPVISMDANGESLLQGCHFNDEMHKFFKINGSGIKKASIDLGHTKKQMNIKQNVSPKQWQY